MISIVCLLGNKSITKDTLLPSIQSVINQTYQEWELKVVFYNTSPENDTSMLTFQDKRIEVKKYGEEIRTYIQTLVHVVNNDATNNYIGILDINDIWEPNKLEVQVAKLKEFSRIDVIGTKSKYIMSHTFNTEQEQESEIPVNGLYNYNLLCEPFYK